MASAIPKIHSRTISLGSAPAGTSIVFKVHAGTGFEANAILLLETLTLATWKSSELLGTQISEGLVTKGFYTLQVTCAFTSRTPSDLVIDFSLGNSTKVHQAKFKGKSPEVARAIADVFIV
jgi:hypothetical protein